MSTPDCPSTARSGGRLFGRHVGMLVVISICVSLFLTLLDGHGFFDKLVYSLCVAGACSLAMDSGRVLMQVLQRRLLRDRPGVAAPSRWWGVALGAPLAVLIGPPLGLTLADALMGQQSPSVLNWSSASTRVTFGLTIAATLIAIVVAATLERLAAAREQAQIAQRQAAEHQLRLLQSQLEPHMLFNTLANLRVLIGLDPAQAQAMLDRLIAYLRATLAASRSDRHALSAEFERTADYLALMAVRMGPRLQVQMDLPESLRARPVPPLLLQPLVENAIQHGLEPHVAGGRIDITARREGDALVLRVRDTGAGLPPPGTPGRADGGFGLTQVRERLSTLHGQAASLELGPATDGEGGTVATVRLPWPADTPSQP